MKKKISLILLSIVQVVVNVMVMMNSTKEAKAFLSGLKESLVGMPEETIKQFTEVFTLDFAKSFITGSCGIIILVTLLFLVLVCFDKISKKKGFSIGLLIVTILLGISDVGFLASAISLGLVISIKSEKSEKAKEKEKKPAISKLRNLKVTNRELVLGLILLVVYASQFVMPYVPMSDAGYIVGITSFYVLVFALSIMTFAKRFKRDFGALRENFGSYFKYILKMWGLMFLCSFVAVFIKSLLGADDMSANQAALNNSDLWFTVPLAMIWAPIVEESIFRGMIRRFIPNNDKLFIVVSAVLFGLLHTVGQEVGLYNTLVQSIQYVAMGGVMAYAYVKSNNICTNIGVHFCQNTLASVLMILTSLV